MGNKSEDFSYENPSFVPDKNDKSSTLSSQLDITVESRTADDNKPGSSRDGDDKEENKEPEQPNTVGVFEMFRFAETLDILLMILGTLAGAVIGAAMPAVIVIFGDMTDNFIDKAAIDTFFDDYWDEIQVACPNKTQEDVMQDPECIESSNYTNVTDEFDWIIDSMEDDFIDEINQRTWYYLGLAGIVLVFGYITIACFMSSAYRQGQRIRTLLFYSILRQEIGWFDTHDSGELNTRLADDVSKIQEGLGDKLSAFIRSCAQFFGGYVVAFIYGWELALVITAASPLIIIAGAIMSQWGASLTKKELNAYAKAGSIAEEVLGSIRTVVAFSGEEKEGKRYTENLADAKHMGVKKSVIASLGTGIVYVIIYASYGLAFWYGSRLVRESLEEGNDDYTAGTMMTVFYGVLIGSFAVGTAAPNIAHFAAARGAAYTIFAIIDSEPKIDSSSKQGALMNVTGNIEFKNVHFKYPSRPDVPILTGLSMSAQVGQTVALVGSSGCGKSTTVQLVQRFYDPEQGQVLLDGVDIRELNVKFLRQQIGVVSQEPVLFATTIRENISYGKDDVTQQEIEEAAKNANAHDFIMKLPDKYSTLVGERGAQLSGGQKQRIAIARALVRDPKILLLDEATSALDMESEAVVQQALDKARAGRTTLVIAHRLSTIRSADVICGVDKGVITEQGTHDELMGLGGIYYTLVTNQQTQDEKDKKKLQKDLDDIEEDSEDDDIASPAVARSLSHSSVKRQLSRSSSIVSKKGPAEEDERVPAAGEIWRLNLSEWPYIACGCVGALIGGVMQPAFAFIFAEIVTVFANPDLEEQKEESNLYALLFVIIGLVCGLCMFIEGYMFGMSGEILTMRLRDLCFGAYLRQDMSFFDKKEHNTGALCTRLATDASAVKNATGAQLGLMVRTVASLLGGIIIGFVYSWQLTLVFMAFAPIIMFAGFLEMSLIKGSAQADKEALEEAGKIAVEAVENIRTVATLTKEDMFYKNYRDNTEIPFRKNMIGVHLRAIAFALSQSFLFCAYAGGFRFGGYLIEKGTITVNDMFKVFGGVVFSAMATGHVSAFAPDVAKAKLAAGRILDVLETEPLIDSSSEEGHKPNKTSGHVALSSVYFNYPTRPRVPILQGLTVEVSPGQTLALVGSSGCGKSTSIQLIERFYDPKSGEVELDGADITGLNIKWLRQQMGLVSQEPILFDASIADNIAYGDNSRHVPMDEIIQAARQANIHNFIISLPDGYNTKVGAKGTQMSGGQKQRIAIARALVRDPKILLLDEATSALDTESEKVVQEALDNARSGRTSIVIAHRLSTIYNADIIAVIHNGKVAEQGTHSELLALKGLYYKLNTIQNKTS